MDQTLRFCIFYDYPFPPPALFPFRPSSVPFAHNLLDTSLTNFFAFILGSTTSLPAVEYFCLYAGMAILFDFFLQVDNNRKKCRMAYTYILRECPNTATVRERQDQADTLICAGGVRNSHFKLYPSVALENAAW